MRTECKEMKQESQVLHDENERLGRELGKVKEECETLRKQMEKLRKAGKHESAPTPPPAATECRSSMMRLSVDPQAKRRQGCPYCLATKCCPLHKTLVLKPEENFDQHEVVQLRSLLGSKDPEERAKGIRTLLGAIRADPDCRRALGEKYPDADEEGIAKDESFTEFGLGLIEGMKKDK